MLREYTQYAQQTGRTFDLYVRPGANISGPLPMHVQLGTSGSTTSPPVMTKRRKRGGMTLAEHDAQLKAEGRYEKMQEAQRQQDEELKRKEAEWRQAEAPLVQRLREAGFEIDSAWDLVNTSTPYPDALPILLEHLERPYPDRVREGIARALAVRDAKFGWATSTRLYHQEKAGTDAKDGLAVAIAATADDEVIDEVISLARDSTHGESRLLLLRALARARTPRARAALEEFGEDHELTKEARRLLSGGR